MIPSNGTKHSSNPVSFADFQQPCLLDVLGCASFAIRTWNLVGQNCQPVHLPCLSVTLDLVSNVQR
jgi:hypothetical protein